MEDQTSEHLEHAEHAEHAAHVGNPFITIVSVTIAILAVVAATIGSLETVESGAAISEKNEAVLRQSQASDQFTFYQAKSLKKNILDVAISSGNPKAADYAETSKRYEEEGKEILKEAKEFEKQRDEKLAESNHHEHRHHILTTGVSLVHVAIAIATVAIITKGQRWPWYGAIILGLAGVAVSAYAYLPLATH